MNHHNPLTTKPTKLPTTGKKINKLKKKIHNSLDTKPIQ